MLHQSLTTNHITILTLFLNPLQFPPNQHFHPYPTQIHKHLQLLSQLPPDILFHPPLQHIYPPQLPIHLKLPPLPHLLQPPNRPPHFHPLLTLLNNLFNILIPHYPYFPKKHPHQFPIVQQILK
ncbi:pantoate--beta-alanine ligase, partial [Staphylococcus aureus]|uniref:pantoate--beta-alanine ligase n=1 Tax=Staphylococcus aureus TaxID=1280 RepID=UPI0037DA20B3